MAQKYKEELFLEWLRSSSESGCIKNNVASKEDFLFGRERIFVKKIQRGGIKKKVDHREEGLFRISFLQRTDYILTKEQLIHIQKAFFWKSRDFFKNDSFGIKEL